MTRGLVLIRHPTFEKVKLIQSFFPVPRLIKKKQKDSLISEAVVGKGPHGRDKKGNKTDVGAMWKKILTFQDCRGAGDGEEKFQREPLGINRKGRG